MIFKKNKLNLKKIKIFKIPAPIEKINKKVINHFIIYP
jgi:hypothetical protein